MHRKESKTTGIVPYILDCICLRLNEKEAINYLKDRGYSISPAEYYRLKSEVKDNGQSRLNKIALEFSLQHLDRIETLRMINNELIENYKKETNPTKKSNILMQLAEIQQLLATFYDSTRWVLTKSIEQKRQQLIE